MKRIILLVLLVVSCLKAKAQTSVLTVADSLYATGNYTKAINYYAQIGTKKARLQIARAYKAIGNYEKAIVQYQSVVESNPNLQIARFELGKLLLKSKAYDEARRLFSALVQQDGDNPEYHYYLGEVFTKINQFSSSLVSYKKAVEKDSTHLRSLFRLGKFFVVKQERDNALFYIEKGLAFYPNDVSLINLKALTLFNDLQYENAIPWFVKLIELGEKKEYIYDKLAYCYFKNWEFDASKTAYRNLLSLDDENGEAYFNLGQVYFKNKELDSAQYFIKKSIEVEDVTFGKEYASLARIEKEKFRLNSALEYYRIAHKEEPSNISYYYQLCVTADQFYKDPTVKLNYYKTLIKKYGSKQPYFSDFALKRISELNEVIHFSED